MNDSSVRLGMDYSGHWREPPARVPCYTDKHHPAGHMLSHLTVQGGKLPGNRRRAKYWHAETGENRNKRKSPAISGVIICLKRPRGNRVIHPGKTSRNTPSLRPGCSPCFFPSTGRACTRQHSHRNETQRNLLYSASWKGKGSPQGTFPDNANFVLYWPKRLKQCEPLILLKSVVECTFLPFQIGVLIMMVFGYSVARSSLVLLKSDCFLSPRSVRTWVGKLHRPSNLGSNPNSTPCSWVNISSGLYLSETLLAHLSNGDNKLKHLAHSRLLINATSLLLPFFFAFSELIETRKVSRQTCKASKFDMLAERNIMTK